MCIEYLNASKGKLKVTVDELCYEYSKDGKQLDDNYSMKLSLTQNREDNPKVFAKAHILFD